MAESPLPEVPAYSDPIDVSALGGVEVVIEADPALESHATLEIQESADSVNWRSHPTPLGTGVLTTTHLPEHPARRFVRLRVSAVDPGPPPGRIRWWMRPLGPSTDGEPGGEEP